MQLFDHANQAKSKDGDSDPASTRDNEASTIRRPPGFNGFDETIVLSFYLVKALHSQYSPESLRLDEKSSVPVGPPPKLDSGTMLIIFSCYVRMLNLFMDRLGALRSALSANATPPLTTASSRAGTATPSILPPNGSSPGRTPGPNPGPNGAALLLPTLVACGCPLEGYSVLRLRSKLLSDCNYILLGIYAFHSMKVFHYLRQALCQGSASERDFVRIRRRLRERNTHLALRLLTLKAAVVTLELVEEVLEVTSALVTPIVNASGMENELQLTQSSVVSPQALSAREQAAYRVIRELRMELRRHRSIMVI